MKPLTRTQQRALDAYRALAEELQRDPTVREFAARLGCSSSQTAYRMLQQLRSRQLIPQSPRSRGRRPDNLRFGEALNEVAAAALAYRQHDSAANWHRQREALDRLLSLGWQPPASSTTAAGADASRRTA